MSLVLLTKLLASAIPTAHAFDIDLTGLMRVCQSSILPCNGILTFGGGAAGLNSYILVVMVGAIRVVFVAVALVVAFISGVSMVIYPQDENVVKEGRTSYVYIIIGGAIVTVADTLVNTFLVGAVASRVSTTALGPSTIETGLSVIITFIGLVMGIALVVNIVVQAMRILSSQGDQAQIEKARKRLVGGFIGVAFILLARPIAIALDPRLQGSTLLGAQVAGIGRFLVTLVGGGAVIAFVVGGLLLIFSVDESLRDKAKNFLKVGVVAILVVAVAYPLLVAFAGV